MIATDDFKPQMHTEKRRQIKRLMLVKQRAFAVLRLSRLFILVVINLTVQFDIRCGTLLGT